MAVKTKTQTLNPNTLPPGSTFAFKDWLVRLNGTTNEVIDTANGAETTADEAKKIAEEQRQRNDDQDVILVDHGQRLDSAENRLNLVETDIASLDSRTTDLETNVSAIDVRVSDLETDVSDLQNSVSNIEARLTDTESDITTLQGDVAAIDARVYALEVWRVYMTRQKAEVAYSGISLAIPTTPSNLLTLLGTLTPTSGSLAPFFNTTTGRMTALAKDLDLKFKLSIRGTFAGGSANRSMQLTFNIATPDTIVVSRNDATTIDDLLFSTWFGVDAGGELATSGTTITIQSNGSEFTATQIKLVATQ